MIQVHVHSLISTRKGLVTLTIYSMFGSLFFKVQIKNTTGTCGTTGLCFFVIIQVAMIYVYIKILNSIKTISISNNNS